MKIKVKKVKKFFEILAKIIIAVLLSLFLITLFRGIIRITTIICVIVVCTACIVLAWAITRKR